MVLFRSQYRDLDLLRLHVELDRSPWLAILKGDQYGWNLRLILSASGLLNRGAEVYWPRNVTNHVANAMRTMWDSDYL